MLDADPARAKLYERHIAAAAKAAAKQRVSPPEKAARAIVRAVEARRPRGRYAASADVRLLGIVSHLPAGARDALIARMLGLNGTAPAA
jgi:hypothetical protein